MVCGPSVDGGIGGLLLPHDLYLQVYVVVGFIVYFIHPPYTNLILKNSDNFDTKIGPYY